MAIPEVREKDVDYERQPDSHFSDFGVPDPNELAAENERLLAAGARNALGIPSSPLGAPMVPGVGGGSMSSRITLTPQTQVPKQVMPGAAEASLEKQYADEGTRLQSRLAPLNADRARLESEMEGITNSMPVPPKFTPISEFKPQQRTGDEMLAFAGIAMALSAIGARSSGGDIATAMSAAGAAMDGFAKGDMQRAKTEMDNFNTAQKAVVADNQRMLEEYRAVLEDKKLSMQQKMQQYQVISAKYKDEITESAIRRGDLKFALDRLDKVRDGTNQFNLRAAGISSTLEARLTMAESRANFNGPSMDEETAKFLANQFIEGDRQVMSNLGRGVQGAANVALIKKHIVSEAMARGMTPKDVAVKLAEFKGLESAQRTLGTREANIDTAANEAAMLAPLALDAADNVARTGFVPVNKLVQLGAEQTGSPEQRRFIVANRSLLTAYTQVMARTGARTVHDTQEVERMLITADSPEAYKAGVEQILMEIQAAKQAPRQTRDALREGFQNADNPRTSSPQINLGPRRISSDAEFNSLPSGTEFIGPDNVRRRKP